MGEKKKFPVEVPVVTGKGGGGGGSGRFRVGSLFTDMRERILLKKKEQLGIYSIYNILTVTALSSALLTFASRRKLIQVYAANVHQLNKINAIIRYR